MQHHQEAMREVTIALYQQQLPLNTRNFYDHALVQSGSLPRYSAHVLGSAAGAGPPEGEEADKAAGGEAQGGVGKVQLRVGQGPLALDSELLSSLQYLHAPGTEVRSSIAGICHRREAVLVVL